MPKRHMTRMGYIAKLAGSLPWSRSDLGKRWSYLRSLRVLVFACVLLVSSVALLPSGAGASRSSVVSSHQVGASEAAGNYWTSRRMAAAPWRQLPQVSLSELRAAEPAAPDGEPHFVEGTAPALAPEGGTEYAASAGPIPFVASEIEDPSVETIRTHGALFFSDPTGDYGCSGTLVNSDNRSVVWTAAHCVYGDGAYFTNMVFIPGYEEGRAPYGQWEAERLVVPDSWIGSEDPMEGNDFAAVVLKANSSGAFAGDVVGTRGIAFNQQPTESFQSFGYPALPTTLFDGEHLHSCTSAGSGRILPLMIAMGCNMKEGSSGGGWVIRGEYVASNQSIGIRGLRGLAFGPYLGSEALALYDSVRGGTTVFPSPTPTGPPAPYQEHKMKVTLDLSKHLVATGKVTAASGHVGCTQLVPIRVARLKNTSSGLTIVGLSKTVFTNANGAYKVRLRDRAAYYGTIAFDGTYDLSNDCSDAFSRAKRHRHT